jgi:hypothetical protein
MPIILASVLEENKKKVLVCIATSSNIEHISMTTRLGEAWTLKKNLTGEIHMNMGDCWDTLTNMSLKLSLM